MTERTINDRITAVMGEMNNVPKDAFNAHGKYKYASADAVYDAVRPVLARHGLSVTYAMQPMEVFNVAQKETTILPVIVWFEGEERRAVNRIPLTFLTAQGVQAAITYAVKYFLKTRLLLNTGDADVDADAQDTTPPKPTPQPFRLNEVNEIETDTGQVISENMELTTDQGRKLFTFTMNIVKSHKEWRPILVGNRAALSALIPEAGREKIKSVIFEAHKKEFEL